jgi:hypothetical protein
MQRSMRGNPRRKWGSSRRVTPMWAPMAECRAGVQGRRRRRRRLGRGHWYKPFEEDRHLLASNDGFGSAVGVPDSSPPGGLGSINHSPILERVGRDNYRLNAEGLRLLRPYFKSHFNFDVTRVRFQFRDQGPDGITIGNNIYLRRGDWSARSIWSQVRLLGHELAHSVQYRQLGTFDFIARYYGLGFLRGSAANYGIPDDMWTKIRHMDSQSVVHPDFTLDQLADRVGLEVASQVPWP